MNIWISVENQQDYAQMRPSIKAKRKRNDEEAIVDVVQPSLLNKEVR